MSTADKRVTFNVVYHVGPALGGFYVASGEAYDTREAARTAASKTGSSFADVFPSWKVPGVLKALNKSVDSESVARAFQKIVELWASTTDSDSFSSEVCEVLASLGKVYE